MQTHGLSRDTVDKFYTCPETVKSCMDILKQWVKPQDLIVEPSAGNGAFLESIKSMTDDYIFYDIRPEHVDIMEQDFLKVNPKTFHNHGKIHVVGNPPFGRQSSLAIKFIRHSAQFCQTIAFILPRSFKKDSMKNKVPLDFHCVHESDIPRDAFLMNGKSHNVPCIFQVWIRKDTPRLLSPKLVPQGFEFVKKSEPHHISFRRVGINAGNIDTATQDKSEQSHYFIKFDNFDGVDVNLLKKIHFDTSNNTVGPKSISKQELVKEFNLVL